jgi:hypothetical protein
VIRHLPQNTPAQDISDGLMTLGFDVINVKQMTTTRRTPQETKIITLLLFLITLPRTPKSQEIFRLQKLCHIAIRVEAYRNQNSLTQCYNCHSLATYGQTASSHPAVCGAGPDTCTRSAPRKRKHFLHLHAATAGWRTVRNRTPPTIGDAATRRRSCRRRSYRGHPKPQREGCSPLAAPPQASPSRRHSEAAETSSSSSNHRQAKFRWIHHPQQQGRIYGPLHCRKQVSQSRPLL